MLLLTKNTQPVVDSDNHQICVARQDTAVVWIPRIPFVRLPVHVQENGIPLHRLCRSHWNITTVV